MSRISLVPRAGINEVLARAKEYILGRQCKNGAFCFYRSEYIEEPNVQDTYHAIVALKLLRADVPRADEAVNFLTSFDAVESNAIYYAAFALDAIGHAASVDAQWLRRVREWTVRAPAGNPSGATTGWLESTLRILRLKRRFAELSDSAEVADFVRSLKKNGGYGSKPNLYDTYLCLSILDLLSALAISEDTCEFLRELQVPNFGFTATRDSILVDLDLIYAGIECCAMAGVSLRFGAAALNFALDCQISNGGFSRTSNALPDLEQTHRALQIIALLRQIPTACEWC